MSHPNLYFTNTTLKNNILLYMESAIFFFFFALINIAVVKP